MIDFESVLKRANELYGEAKGNPERLIGSNQVMAALRALIEAPNLEPAFGMWEQ